MLCPRCNNQLPDGARFCNSCGVSLASAVRCPNCGNYTESSLTNCKHCGVNIQGDPMQPQYPPQQTSASKQEKKNNYKKVFIFVGIGAGVSMTAFIAMVLVVIFVLFGNNTPVIYVKDGGLFYSDLKNNPDTFSLTDELVSGDYAGEIGGEDYEDAEYMLGKHTVLSQDGSLIFFPAEIGKNGSYDLYYRETDKNSSAILIDSGVSSYAVNSDATLVTYLKNGDKELYQYDIKDEAKEKIASDVTGFLSSADGKKILFSNHYQDIYLKSHGEDKTKLVSEAESLYCSDVDNEILIYSKDKTLYTQNFGEERTTVASDVYRVVSAYKTGEVYYFKEDSQSISLYDYINDDLYDSDSLTERPQEPEQPSRWDYESFEEYQEAYVEYRAAFDEYQNAFKEYSAKMNRDELRSSLSERTLLVNRYSLYYFDGENSILLNDNVDASYSSYTESRDSALLAFTAHNTGSFQKPAFSEITDLNLFEIEDKIEALIYGEPETNIAIGGKLNVLTEDTPGDFSINSSCDKLFYLNNADAENSYDLYCVTIDENGNVSAPLLYDTDISVDAIDFINDDTVVYMKNLKDSRGDLYINGDLIDENVYLYGMRPLAENGALAYFTDWNNEKQRGTLNLFNGNESLVVAADVHSFTVLNDGKILYLYDYSTTRYQGELYEWDNGVKRKIDDDVNCIINPQTAGYNQ